MYHDFTVKIPDIKGKIIIKKKGGSSYALYEYGRDYKPEKKYTIPKRTIIGKISEQDSSLMYPNERYQEYFPEAVFPEERPEAYRSCCLKIGTYIVIDKILEEYKLKDQLKKHLGNDYGLFMDLMAYLIVDEENAGQYYPDFAYCHPLFSDKMKIYSDVKVSRLFSSITRNQSNAFLDDWNKKRDHKQRIYVSYDSTNKNCQAGDIDILEFGKAKVGQGTPIFNLAVAYDCNNRIPLLYEEYPGSINDVSQFHFMIDKVNEYGYKNVGFILDRGYFSKDNIMYMKEKGYEFIIMAKGCRKLVSSMVDDVRGTFETNRSCSIRPYRVYGTTRTEKLYPEDTEKRCFHIYYNPSKQAAEREQLEQKIDRYKEFIQKNEGTDQKFGKTYQDYFDFTYDKKGILLYATEKSDVIQQELELCGYFCIITSENMTAEAALIKYKGRDISEKLFSADKSFLGSKSMRVQSAESMSAKLFLEFVTLIVRNRIYNLLKEEMMRIEIKPNYLTVPAAVRELEKIEMVRRNKGSYRLDHAVTKKQKDILAAFGLGADDVIRKANEISQLLKAGMSMADLAEEEDTDGETEINRFD
ncbi:MAG: hypothetical protein PWP24_1622 [Clostridiales bacterium]|nr:hypothetical protein [Clostridiales bacterium]